jgi:hypothetical protein
LISATLTVSVTPVTDPPLLTVATLPVSSGAGVPLNITAVVSDSVLTDAGGEHLTGITIRDIPPGTRFTNARGDTLNAAGGSLALTPPQLAGLIITPPPGFSGSFMLTIVATAQDGTAMPNSTSAQAMLKVTATPPPEIAMSSGLPPDFNLPELPLFVSPASEPSVFFDGDRTPEIRRLPIPFQPVVFVSRAVEISQIEREESDPRGSGTDTAAVSLYATRWSSLAQELGFDPAIFVQNSVQQSQREAHFLDLRVSGRHAVIDLSSDELLAGPSLFQALPLGNSLEPPLDETEARFSRASDGGESAILDSVPPQEVARPATPVAAKAGPPRNFSEQLREASVRLRPLSAKPTLERVPTAAT